MVEIMQYIRKDGAFHRLNAITKIVFLIAVVAGSVITTNPVVLGGIVLSLFIVGILSGIHRELLRQIPAIVLLSAGLILLTVLTMQSGTTYGCLIPEGIPFIGGSFPVTEGALLFAGVLSLRFFAMLFAFQMVIISTQPRDLVHALQRMKLPVDYSLMLLIALRFIPGLQIEGKRIQEAQLARAYNPGKGMTGKVRALAPIMVPLVSNALGKAGVLGLTIDLRGLRTQPFTPLTDKKLKIMDLASIFIIGIGSVVLVTGIMLT